MSRVLASGLACARAATCTGAAARSVSRGLTLKPAICSSADDPARPAFTRTAKRCRNRPPSGRRRVQPIIERGELSQTTARLPACPAAARVADCEKDGLNFLFPANTLFSAAKTEGAVHALLHLLLDHGHDCRVDDYVVIEARRNLAAKEPAALSRLESLLKRLRISPAQAPGPELRLVNWLPEKDRTVLAAAIRLRSDALVTGDRTHFGAGCGKVYAGVTIHSPRSLAEQLLK